MNHNLQHEMAINILLSIRKQLYIEKCTYNFNKLKNTPMQKVLIKCSLSR